MSELVNYPAENSNSYLQDALEPKRPDQFFTAEQQQRREQLMAQWREAQDTNAEFPAELQAELEQIILAEVRAAGQRAASLSPSVP